MSGTQETKLLQTFGRRVAGIRKSKSMTQSDLAEKVNMSVVAIAYIETGKRWVRLSTLDKIAKVLKTNVSDLLRGV